MKSIDETGRMSIEELEAVSRDERICIPDGLEKRLEDALEVHRTVRGLAGMSAGPDGRLRSRRFLMGAAASFVLLAGLGAGLIMNVGEPEDTFTDPYLAYAEVERAFAKMSDGVRKGIAMAEESQQTVERTISVFE